MPVHFLDARQNQCRRPLWDLSQAIGDVCGEPVAPGKSYCPECCRRLLVVSPMRAPGVRDSHVQRVARSIRAEQVDELTGVLA